MASFNEVMLARENATKMFEMLTKHLAGKPTDPVAFYICLVGATVCPYLRSLEVTIDYHKE